MALSEDQIHRELNPNPLSYRRVLHPMSALLQLGEELQDNNAFFYVLCTSFLQLALSPRLPSE